MRALWTRTGVAIGLLFLIGPIADLAETPRGSARTTAILLCTGAFVLVYCLVLPPSRVFRRLGRAELYARRSPRSPCWRSPRSHAGRPSRSPRCSCTSSQPPGCACAAPAPG